MFQNHLSSPKVIKNRFPTREIPNPMLTLLVQAPLFALPHSSSPPQSHTEEDARKVVFSFTFVFSLVMKHYPARVLSRAAGDDVSLMGAKV